MYRSTGPLHATGPLTTGTAERPPNAVDLFADPILSDAAERCGEVVEVALAAHLPVSDDVDPGCDLIVDGEQGRGILRVFQIVPMQPPHVVGAGARHAFA